MYEESETILYCIASVHLYSASCSAHQSEALPREKRAVLRERKEALDLAHQLIKWIMSRELVPKRRVVD